MLLLLLFFFFLFFFFVFFLLGLAVDFCEDVVDRILWRLDGLSALFVGVVVDPAEPRAPLADVFDDDEIVAVGVGPFDPVLEAGVLELQNIINLDLVHPLLIVDHDLSDICLQEQFSVDDEAAVLLDQQPRRMNHVVARVVSILVFV